LTLSPKPLFDKPKHGQVEAEEQKQETAGARQVEAEARDSAEGRDSEPNRNRNPKPYTLIPKP